MQHTKCLVYNLRNSDFSLNKVSKDLRIHHNWNVFLVVSLLTFLWSLCNTSELNIVSVLHSMTIDKHVLPEVKCIALGIYTLHTDLHWPPLTWTYSHWVLVIPVELHWLPLNPNDLLLDSADPHVAPLSPNDLQFTSAVSTECHWPQLCLTEWKWAPTEPD